MSELKKRKLNIEKRFFFPKAVQTELTSEDIDLLFLYYKNAVEERNELLIKISTLTIDVKFFENNDKKTRFYTGLTTWKLLNAFFKLVEPFLPEHGNAKLSPFQMLVLTLMKLRLNLTFTDLGYRFQIEANTASRYFHRCIFILFQYFTIQNWFTGLLKDLSYCSIPQVTFAVRSKKRSLLLSTVLNFLLNDLPF